VTDVIWSLEESYLSQNNNAEGNIVTGGRHKREPTLPINPRVYRPQFESPGASANRRSYLKGTRPGIRMQLAALV